jgi:dTDP-L-rhamnose 4-epimerase
MRVLLTGGAGFIGRQVLRALTGAGHEVRVLDSLRTDVHGDSPEDVAEDLAEDLAADLVVGDVRDPAALDPVLADTDVVCHLAAKVGLGVDAEDLPDYASSNDHGTAVLLAAMTRAGVGRLVLASSMVIYGGGVGRCAEHGSVRPASRREADLRVGRFEPPCPECGTRLAPTLVAEDTVADPRNGYAASKLAQEHLASAWARATGGSVAALRYHNVYGPGMPVDTPYAGVAAIFRSALRSGSAPQVFEDGGQRRDFVHVRDVAVATCAAAERVGESNIGSRSYNVGSGTPRTVGDMANALHAVLGGPEPQITGRYRLGDVRHITADSSRIRDELGWTPVVDFTAGVADLSPR